MHIFPLLSVKNNISLLAVACIETEVALFQKDESAEFWAEGEIGSAVEWNSEFLDSGSASSKFWTQVISKAVPSIHFVSEYKIATVEIRKITFFEFNDQVVFKSKMDVRTTGNIQVQG